MTDKFPWMEHVCYEPAPTLTPIPSPIPLCWRIFLVLAAADLIAGGLMALTNWEPQL